MKKIILIFFLLLFAYFYFNFFSPLEVKPAREETFIVKLNDTETQIINRLYSKGFIKNISAFEFILTLKDSHNKFLAGGYFISKNMHPWDIADILSSSPAQIWISIPEGLRKEETAEILQKNLNWNNSQVNEFINSSEEGYLSPNTYLFNSKTSPENAIQKLNAQLYKEKPEISSEIIVSASLIQREAKNKEEMLVISGIINNRIKKAIPLSIDATIQYALGTAENWWPVIKKEDYKLDSSFNTYLYKGFPPSPICNPGIQAINAAINPANTEYLYYLHDKDGNIYYAETYDEHLDNMKE